MALPAPLNELWGAWNDIQGNAAKPVMVNLIGPAGEYRDGMKQMLTGPSGRHASLRVLDPAADVPPDADLHFVMLDAAFGPSASQLSVLRKLNPKTLVLILLGGDESQFEGRRREVATAVGARLDHVIAARSIATLRPLFAKQLIALFEEFVVPLARQFPFMRDEAANHEIGATSQQNAMVGAMPIPGADLPIMTANQIKMVLRLAAMYDQAMTMDRLKEVLAVVGGGFALRAAARQVAKFIPGPGWIVGGALGYAGTQAMGRASIEYFKRTTEPLAPGATRQPASDRRNPVIDTEAEVVHPASREPGEPRP